MILRLLRVYKIYSKCNKDATKTHIDCSTQNNAVFSSKVPFGKLAFMPGRLVHTNEITVLLGDNWFAEVSAKDAIGITGQRVTGK